MTVTRRRILLVLAALAVVGVIVYAFLPKPVDVDLAPVTRGPLQVTVDEDGKTRIKERYIVAAPLAGRLARITLDPGDEIASGKTLLASIEPPDPALLDARTVAEAEARVRAAEASLARADPAVEAARAELEYSETDLGRIRRLAERTAISAQERDAAELRHRRAVEEYRSATFAQEIARFELEQAQAALLRTNPHSGTNGPPQPFEIHSPIDGRVLRVIQESATVVTPGMELIELGDPSDLEMEIDVLSSDAVKIKPGYAVLVEQWGGNQPLRGVVRVVEPSGFTKISALGVEEQRVNVIVDFTDPHDHWSPLGDNYRVEAKIVIWESPDVLRVPTSALFRHGDSWAVFVHQRGRAVLRPVTIGQRNGLEAEVLDGLDENEQVIIHPSDRIRDGVAVRQRELG